MRKIFLDPAARLSLLYITALSSIGVVAVISQVIIRTNIQSQKYDGKVVNMSGRQRMLSQRLSKEFLLLEKAEDDSIQQIVLHRLLRHHYEWRNAHLFLSDQAESQGKKIKNTPAVRALFANTQAYFDSIDHACRLVIRAEIPINAREIAEGLRTILQAEPQFLNCMEKITDQYEREAAGKVMYLEKVEFFLFLVTLLILATESLFVLLPAVKKLRLYFQQLLEANHALEDAAEQIHESRRLLLNSSLEAQERERKRIAMELHDGLGPLIALAKLNINHLQGKVPDADAKFTEKSLEYLHEIHQGIKQISGALMPYALEQFGLKIALENLIDEVQTVAKPEINLYVNLEPASFDKTFELNVYRLVQELLNNAVRHAEASQISVQVFADEGRIVVMIEDDGKGLLSDNPLQSSGLGLKNIMSRVNAFDGYLNIDTNPQDGTTITIYIPLPT